MTRFFSLSGILSAALISLMFTVKQDSFISDAKDQYTDAHLYTDYMHRMRANQVTGKINPADVIRARQQADNMVSSRSVNLQWHEVGPDNIGGRTRAVLFDSKNQGIAFAGGVGGGLWKSTNGGQSWETIGDDWSNLAVCCITQASNGDIYVGTGEGITGNTGTDGEGLIGNGIWKSSDGGNTFNHLDATTPSIASSTVDWADVNRIAVSSSDPNHVYAATNTGIKISHDGGLTWSNAQGSLPVSNSTDIIAGSDGFIYAVIINQYYRSTAADGDVFELRTGQGGFPTTQFIRIEMAVAPSDPHYVYASCANTSGGMGGVFQSSDGGLNWIQIGPSNSSNFNPFAPFEPGSGGQGDYDNTVAVLPTDPQTVFIGGQGMIYRYRPADGWQKIVDAYLFPIIFFYVHPNIHAFSFNPFRPSQLLIGCDGGVYMTDDASITQPTFYSVTRNYRVTQMFSVAGAPDGKVIGGCQGNGTIYIDSSENTKMSAREILGSDGGYTDVSRINPSAFFAARPGGATGAPIYRSPTTGTGFATFYDTRIDADGDGRIDEGSEYITPFLLWESIDGSNVAFFACGSNNSAWITVNPLNFSITPDWFRLLPTGSTLGNVTCLAFSKDGNHLFAGTSQGMVYHFGNIMDIYKNGKFTYPSVTSAASAWQGTDSGLVIASALVDSGRYIRAIAVDPSNPNNIIVTAANYGNTSYVWRSTNALESVITFTDITGNLPLMPVYGACIPGENPNYIIVGTELGTFAQDLTEGTWTEENNGMPRAATLMVREQTFNSIPYLYVATHGRGIFRSGSLAGVNDGVVDHTPEQDVTIFPNPVTSMATIRINLPTTSTVMINLYDLDGKIVRVMDLRTLPSGQNIVQLKTNDLAAGTYLLSVQTGAHVYNQKIVVLK